MPRREVTLLQELLKPNSKGRGNSMQNYRYTQKLTDDLQCNEVRESWPWLKSRARQPCGAGGPLL